MRNYHNIFWTKYYELRFRAKTETDDTIYMFHSIHDGETDPKSFVSNREGFSLFLSEECKKRTPCTLDEILSESPGGRFAITFDDVFENVYTNAYPVLKEHRIPFTLFVSPGLLGKPGYLTQEQLLALAEDPRCTIGAHTVHHVRLRTAKTAYQEILQSKETLSQMLKREISYFAYPYGSVYACSRKNIRQTKKAGFSAAFATIKGAMPKKWNRYRYFLPRNNGDHFVKKLEEGNF